MPIATTVANQLSSHSDPKWGAFIFRITTAVNSIRPVRITVRPMAITHFASKVCHRLMATGWRCRQMGPISVVAYPRTASIEVPTITAPRNPQKVVSSAM
ncbi:MAG: hypothetical protein WBP81_28230 [Solirubrobacteraceae bacterium]